MSSSDDDAEDEPTARIARRVGQRVSKVSFVASGRAEDEVDGAAPRFRSLGMEKRFRGHTEDKESRVEVGAWQKHTTGIGLKLLQKFGFKGRLGANEDGIAQPVDVVQRPMGEGLGFSTGSSNAQSKGSHRTSSASASASGCGKHESKLPTEEVVRTQSWKKDASSQKAGKVEPKLLRVSDFLGSTAEDKHGESKTQTILDMRGEEVRVLLSISDMRTGSSSATVHVAGDIVPKLGQELLYNINLVVDMTEAEVLNDSKKAANETHRAESSNVDMAILRKELERDSLKLERLEKLIEALTRIESKRLSDASSVSIEAIIKAMMTLYSSLTDEFLLFGILHLLPTLVTPILQALVADWNPLVDASRLADILAELNPLVTFFSERGEAILAQQSQVIVQEMLENFCLPVIKRSLSNAWEAETSDNCVYLMKTLQSLLPQSVVMPIFDTMIKPKLDRAINAWSHDGHAPLHVWLHPWLPLLGSDLSSLFPDVRRKLGQMLKARHITDTAVFAMVCPWLRVFDMASLHNLLNRSVVPKLVDALRDMRFEMNIDKEDVLFKSIMRWYGIVPHLRFVCLLEGEFFPKWLNFFATQLKESELDQVRVWYLQWKKCIPDSLFASEVRVRRPFNVALDLINDHLLGIETPSRPLPSVSTSYSLVLERRLNELQGADLHGAQKSKPFNKSFRDKLEDVAGQQGKAFAPKEGVKIEGQQVYTFGKASLFVQQDVIFAKSGREYQAVSIAQLLEMS
jgi:tuftelin-interacting protein 11